MQRYSNRLRSRAKSHAWRLVNNALDLTRAPIRRPEILLVTGNASDEKITDAEARLRFLLSHLKSSPTVRRARNATSLDYLRYAGVAALETTAIPEFLVHHIRWCADIDFDKNPDEGWDIMNLATALNRRPLNEAIAKGRAIFKARVHEIMDRGPRPVYLFGTGPSLNLANQRSFTDGTTIVCNTIVRDADLWNWLQPAFFTAGDPIYHFGHTEHARTFRADALRRLQESEGRTLFVYPAAYDFILRSEFRSVEDVLVPIPWGEHTDISVNLLDHYTLPYVDNVINMLLMPLACTLSSDIRLWGFDGRAPDDTGFWSYSSRNAYPELIPSIKEAHPAFFKEKLPVGNEFSYVKKYHGDWLDDRLADAENRGFSIQMLHESWTPTFQKRYRNRPPLD